MMIKHRYKAEPYKGRWVVYDTVTREPYQSWTGEEDAPEHADELNFYAQVVQRDLGIKFLQALLTTADENPSAAIGHVMEHGAGKGVRDFIAKTTGAIS